MRTRGGPARLYDLESGDARILYEPVTDIGDFSGTRAFDFAPHAPLAFSGGGAWLSAISEFHADRVYDSSTGAHRFTLGYDGPTFDQSWSLDDTRLLTVHDDAIRLWDLGDSSERQLAVFLAEDWVALAIERVSRGFTPGECSAYRLEPCPSTLSEVLRLYRS